MSSTTRRVGYVAGGARKVHHVSPLTAQVERTSGSCGVGVDDPPSAVRTAERPDPPAVPRTGPQPGGDDFRPSLSLPVFAVAGGSFSVLVGALAALVAPDGWSVPVWIGLATVLCAAVGLSADKFVK